MELKKIDGLKEEYKDYILEGELIHITIGDIDYHILNSDTTTLRLETVKLISDYFSKIGFKAICECLGDGKRTFNAIIPRESIKADKTYIKGLKKAENNREDYLQISLFNPS